MLRVPESHYTNPHKKKTPPPPFSPRFESLDLGLRLCIFASGNEKLLANFKCDPESWEKMGLVRLVV